MNQTSLLDGIDISAKKPAPRKSFDAAWNKQRKTVAVVALVVMSVGTVSYGAYYAWSNRPPALPTTADQAIALISSNKLDTLPIDRQEQYLEAASDLLKDLPEEQRRELFRNDKNRDALERIREQQFDDMARKFAKGEDPDWMRMRGPGMGPGGPPGGGPGGGGGNGNGGGDGGGGDRGKAGRPGRGDPDARRAMMDQRMAKSLNSGNAQSVGLRGEMMKRMQAARQAGGGGNGGQRRPGGGG